MVSNTRGMKLMCDYRSESQFLKAIAKSTRKKRISELQREKLYLNTLSLH